MNPLSLVLAVFLCAQLEPVDSPLHSPKKMRKMMLRHLKPVLHSENMIHMTRDGKN